MTYTLVTGATSDIGKQVCVSLERSGHSLLLTDLSIEALEDTLKGLEYPNRHRILSLDFSNVEESKNSMQEFLTSNHMLVSHAVFAAGIFSVKPLRMVDYSFMKSAAQSFLWFSGVKSI